MDSQTKTALIIGGTVLAAAGVAGSIYFMSKPSPPSSSSSSSVPSSSSSAGIIDDNPEQTSKALDLIRKSEAQREDVGLGEFGGGKRRRKTRRNMHGLKLLKKKSKGVRRSHRRAHK